MTASRQATVTIDLRPRGMQGPLALERVRGQTIGDHLFDLADAALSGDAVVNVLLRDDERDLFAGLISRRRSGKCLVSTEAPTSDARVLRADRLYDQRKLRRALPGVNVIHTARGVGFRLSDEVLAS